MGEINEPIRVAQMMTEMNYGGVEMVVMNYYRHIDRKKIQFDFFVLEGSEIPQREEIESMGGRIYVVPHYKHLVQYEKTLIRLFKENRYKIVHSHMNSLSVFSLRAAKKAGVPVRIAHNHSTAGKGEYKKNIIKYMLRHFAKVYPTELFACSHLAGDWLYGKNANYTVFNNAIELDKFAYNEQVREKIRKQYHIENKYVLGHVGRFCYQKNHDFLIDIFEKVHEKEKDAVLLLIGEGELEEQIKAKVHRLGLDESVIFAGACNNVNEMYQAMDVFVFPSRYEGLGMVAIEAQAASLPVICSTNVPNEAKILEDTLFEDTLDEYVNDILRKLKTERCDTVEWIRKAGFDIEKEADMLMKKYFKNIGIQNYKDLSDNTKCIGASTNT